MTLESLLSELTLGWRLRYLTQERTYWAAMLWHYNGLVTPRATGLTACEALSNALSSIADAAPDVYNYSVQPATVNLRQMLGIVPKDFVKRF